MLEKILSYPLACSRESPDGPALSTLQAACPAASPCVARSQKKLAGRAPATRSLFHRGGKRPTGAAPVSWQALWRPSALVINLVVVWRDTLTVVAWPPHSDADLHRIALGFSLFSGRRRSIHIHRSALSLGFCVSRMAMAMAMACTGAWGRILQVPSYRGASLARADASGVKDPVTGTSTPEGDALLDRVKSKTGASTSPAAPAIYTATPSKRDTRTPHSGYHFDGTSRRFFEGWYFKVSIPEAKQSFAWMYSVEDPGTALNASSNGMAIPFGDLFQGVTFPGVGAQIMGADDKYLWHFDENVAPFWGSRHELALGHTFLSKGRVSAPKGEVNPKEFLNRVQEGFQATPTWHQGCLRDNGRTNYVETVPTARWEYSTRPIYGWGDKGAEQKATAGWLAALPVFEPHWQICMAGGLSTGWIEWGGERYEFEDAPSYSEKNWGGSFPLKWFWVQCNVFDGVAGEVALTAGGGRRGLPFLPGQFEEVAMVGVHYDGRFYEFVPWEGNVEWEVTPWGSWKMFAQRDSHEVSLEATADTPGCTLRAPTSDMGLAPFCKDTFAGKLKLKIWERRSGMRGQVILDITSDMCALEVGGGPWYSTWKTKARVQEPLKSLLRYSVDVESLFNPAPQLKPPGL